MKLSKLLLLGAIGCASLPQNQSSSYLTIEAQSDSTHRIIYKPEVINKLIFLYHDRRIELPLCQLGNKKDNTYFIEDIRVPTILTSDSVSANYRGKDCTGEKKYLGLIHNHIKLDDTMPDEVRCQPGTTDLKRFINEKESYIESIVCEVNYPDKIRISGFFKDLLPQDIRESYKEP